MNETTIRFLKSINIQNISFFDMDFTSTRKDKETGVWEFNISKDTGWDFDLLFEFEEKLLSIKYKYKLNFD
ncbi:MAG: hypothetical protein HUJ61_02690, partial [Bacilli bacterium]|nr:hypothetical protein [Bacilli bacterium]